MKTGKKILSVLLAAVLLLSFGMLAFADDEAGDETSYTWVRIPSGSSGLNKGSYYLDWSAYSALRAADDPDNTAADYLAIFNAGEYYVDYDKLVMKGSYTVPAGFMGNEEALQMQIIPEESFDYVAGALNQVGLEWKPVAFSSDGLKAGDYYFDMDALTAGVLDLEIRSIQTAYAQENPDADPMTAEEATQILLEGMIEDGDLPAGSAADAILPALTALILQEFTAGETRQTFFVNPDKNSKLFQLKAHADVADTPEGGEPDALAFDFIFPLMLGVDYEQDIEAYETYETYAVYYSAVRQVAPSQDQEEEDTEPQPDLIAEAYVKIMSFFKKIWDFFIKLFKFW